MRGATRFFTRIAALGLVVALVLVGASSVVADELGAAVNTLRSTPLSISADPSRLAGRSASAQAAAGMPFHADLTGLLATCESAGEVVGAGPNVSAIMAAFRDSPSHMSVIANPTWTTMGTGQERSDEGILYVSVVFCRESGQAPPVPSTSTTAPTGVPAPGHPQRSAEPSESGGSAKWLPDDAPHDWVVGVCWGLEDRDRSLDVERAPTESGPCPHIS